jgi:hypothetical protein
VRVTFSFLNSGFGVFLKSLILFSVSNLTRCEMLSTTQIIWRTGTIVALLSVTSIIASAQMVPSRGENKTPPEGSSKKLVEPESYAIYSTLLSQHYGEWFRKNKSVAISVYTAAPSHGPGSELIARCESGADNETDRELIGYLWSSPSKRLEAKLAVPGAYHLTEGKANVREGLEPGIIWLSPVAFSEDRRHAMVWLRNFCGGLCGSGMMWTLDSRDGDWKVGKSIPSCGFIS